MASACTVWGVRRALVKTDDVGSTLAFAEQCSFCGAKKKA
jgi:hypothetical protein